jgi:hypothetical protein
MILELLPDGTRIRMMGRALVSQWEHDYTGAYLDLNMRPADRTRFRRNVHTVCNHPVGACATGETSTSLDRQLEFEMVVLPLAVDAEKPLRCVLYRENLADLFVKERKIGFEWPTKVRWIDVGAGVPS